MTEKTIILNAEKTIGVTFNKSDNNIITGAKVTVKGKPTYKDRVLKEGSFDVTSTDGASWTSTDNNDTFKSLVAQPEVPQAVAASVVAEGSDGSETGAMGATGADGSVVNQVTGRRIRRRGMWRRIRRRFRGR